MKKFSLYLIFIVTLLSNTIGNAQYCSSNGSTTYNTGITNVTFNTINNSDVSKNNGYEDFTSTSTTVVRGNAYDLSVSVNSGLYYIWIFSNHTDDTVTIAWIDWNQDGDFLDTGEQYNLGSIDRTNNSLTPNSPLSITIPSTATLGSTRMRITTRYQNAPTSCLTGFDGEVEDYTVNIVSTCATYSLTSTTIVTSPICANTAANVQLTGAAANLPTGTYTVTYNLSGTNTATGNTATMTVSTAGTGTFTTSNLVNSGATTVTITNLTRGSCSNAISSNRTAIVTVLATPAQPSTITGNTVPCQGTSQTYSVTSTLGVTYNWTFPSGWTQTAGGTTNSITVTVGSGLGNITVTPSNGTCSGTARTLAVTPSTTPAQPSIITGNTAPCQGTVGLTYSVTNVPGVSYTWTLPSGWTQTAGGTTNSITVTAGTTGGTMTVTPSNSCGNGTARTLAVSTTTVPSQPSVISGNTAPCSGSSQTYSVSNVSGVSYIWSLPSGWVQTAGGNSNTVTVTAGTASGSIIVTPSNSCGNGTTRSIAVTPIAAPTITSTTPGSTVGTGPVALAATASSGTISWYTVSTGGTPVATGTTYTPTISATTTYYVETNNGTCISSPRTPIVATVIAPAPFTIYYENFDENDGSWTMTNTGTGSVWAHGTGLTAASPSEVGEGSYWYTNTYNNYASNSYTYATSPILSSVGYTDLTFSADVRYNLDADTDDGMIVEYRKRTAGVWSAWTILGSDTSGTNWYDGNNNVNAIAAGSDGWTGDTTNTTQVIYNYFETATNPLPNTLDNSAEFQVRFVFATDASTTDDGAAFDNILIYGIPITSTQPIAGPGSVNNNLKLWLNASSEIGNVTDGSNIITWNDQAFDNNAISLTSSSPSFENNAIENINFNPVIKFDRADQEYFRGKGGYFSHDYFVVIKSNGVIDNTGSNRQVPIAGRVSKNSPGVDGTGLGLGSISLRFTDEVVAHMSSSVPTSVTPSTDQQYGRAFTSNSKTFTDEVIIYNIKTNATQTQTEIYKNGVKIDNTDAQAYNQSTSTYNGVLNFSEFSNQQFYVGVGRFSLNGNIDAYVDGKITEIISYSGTNSTLAQQKIQSYLALKNGITLHAPTSVTADNLNDVNYIDSQGTIIWNSSANAGFNYDIAGIGNDVAGQLNQKQSKTVNTANDITIGLSTIEATNSANTATFSGDRQFLVWGNNQGTLAAQPAVIVNMSEDITPSLTTNVDFISIGRTWKVVETGGNVGACKVSLPKTMLSSTITPPGDYLMFISNSPVFNPTAEYRIMTEKTVNGVVVLESDSYDFNGTKYITFGYAPERTFVRSVYFDGTDDYLDAGNVLNLNTQFTISAWVKRSGVNQTILSKRNNSFTTGYDFGINGSGNFTVRWHNGAMQTITSSVVIPTTQWHHVAIIYDNSLPTAKAKLYIDGVLDTTANLTPPNTNTHSFLIGAADGVNTTSFYNGNIDEVRLWNVALSANQLRYIINQEIEKNGMLTNGKVIPNTITNNEISAVNWANLSAYYPMSTYTYTNAKDVSDNNYTAALRNLKTVDRQTAPLPYVSVADANWNLNSTWQNGTMQTIPGVQSIIAASVDRDGDSDIDTDDKYTIDWNIVQISTNVTVDNATLPGANYGNRTVLGLFVDTTKQLEVTGANPNTSDPYSGTGNGITVSHYLNLNGKIDLQGESQLIQKLDSDLLVGVNGLLERDQQGVGNTYWYNDWASPVYSANDGLTYATIQDVLRDGTNPSSPSAITYTTALNGAVGPPITLSTYWMYKYANHPEGSYSLWEQIGNTGKIYGGQGFLMKGTGTTSNQNYVFVGKPNNGDYNLNITAGYDYLVGNPYASAIDSWEFIDDNPNLTGPLYFWEHYGGTNHNLKDYQAGYATLTKAGGVSATSGGVIPAGVSNLGTSTKIPGRFIPVGQGFFVVGGNTGQIHFKNSQRIFYQESAETMSNYGSVFMKGTANKKAQSSYKIKDLRQKIRLGFESAKIDHRQLLLTIDETTSDAIDRGYDAEIYEVFEDDMYWVIQDKKYVIQATNYADNFKEIPLGVKVKEKGTIKIKIDVLENEDTNQQLFLKDSLLQKTYNLKENPFEQEIEAGEYIDRFYLVFKQNPTIAEEETEVIEEITGIQVFIDNDLDEIQIKKSSDIKISTIKLVNYLGQSLIMWNKNLDDSIVSLPLKLASGVYIIQVNTEKGVINKKIIIE